MYSIIVSGDKVRKYFNPSTISPKIVKLNDRNQEMRNRQNVLCTEYVTSKHLDKVSKDGNKYRMLQFPVTNWATPIQVYQELSRSDADHVNNMKRFLNFNTCTLFMHDGTTDDACRINGFHLHILLQNDSSDTIKTKICKVANVKTAKIVKHKEVYMHMLTAPRVFMGVNNIEFKNRLLGVYLRDSELPLLKNQLTDIEMAAQVTLNQDDELQSEEESSDSEEGAASAFYGLLGMTHGKRKRKPAPTSPEAPVLSMYYMDPADFRSKARDPPSETASLNDIIRGGSEISRQKPSKSSLNIDTAKTLMTKYNRLTSDELFVAICRGGDEDDIFKTAESTPLCWQSLPLCSG
ncbi:hypothetical protein DPMN_085083 [Dreissena polymorpha]|uniref:Uncharacterized protein n=1 Tax=Dreissena polymorpha TaxID=45954 RepID=A0A9D3YC43_DREPO|nr:hypothetical protein DPMN_085083 [Dreissena polymorpha]